MTTLLFRSQSPVSLALFAAALASCGSPGIADPDLANNDPSEANESVQVALTAIPASLRCIRFTTVVAGRTFEQDIDITGLATLTAPVRGLPANQALSITADAFPVACTAVTETTQATWISAPVSVTLSPGVVPTLSFVLRPASGLTGDVNFLFLASTPASKAFPAVVVGQSSLATFTVQNLGPAATGALAATFGGSGASQFKIGTNGCSAPLAPNATCTVAANFAPTTAGAKVATLQIAGTPGGTLPISLTGTALQPAVLAITPPMQNFGTVATGKQSPVVVYTVRNSGGATTAPVAVASSDPAFVVSGSTCGVLAQSEACTFNLQFAPTTVGNRTATITASAGAVTAPATATGVGAAPPAIALMPSVVTFGTIVVGEPKQSMLTVLNTGGFPLTDFTAFIGGNGSGPFTIDARPCTAILPPQGLLPGQTCMIFVNAAGVGSGSGTTNEAATLLVNAGGANPVSATASLTATVTPPVVPNTTSFDFGSLPVGGSSGAVTFTLTNVSSKPQGPFMFSTSHPTIFVVGQASCANFGFAPGSQCTVTVTYNAPMTPGPTLDALLVSPVPGASSFGIRLRGLATAP